MRRLTLVLIVLFTSLYSGIAHAEKVEQLSPQGYVNDFASVLDSDVRQRLMILCLELDQRADAQIAVVTIRSLEGDTVQDFANRLFKKWGVGPKGSDRGVMILLAVDDRQYWTEVGYDLEPILPDGKVGGFGREMVPLLQQNQYGTAVLQITSQISQVIAQDRGVTLASPLQETPGDSPVGIPALLAVLIFLAIVWGGGRLLALLFWLMGLSRYRRGRGYRGGWWMGPTDGWSGTTGGGSWGGGGWGGGGFGGFGGGASGGGGAGGHW